MSYTFGIDSYTSVDMYSNCLADPNNLLHYDYRRFSNLNPVECIEFFMHHAAFREHQSYAPATEFNDAEERIYSEVRSCDWWWNKQVRELSFVLATMTLTTSIV